MTRHGPTPLAGHILAAWRSGDPQKLALFHAGVQRYQNCPWVRPTFDYEVVWQKGSSRLLKYPAGTGTPVFIVPSLINPWWVLDLLPENSLIAWLGAQGFQPYVLDWGVADPATRTLDMDGLVQDNLGPALSAIKTPAVVLGYCLGGTMAVALAQQNPDQVSALALLAAPWCWSCYSADYRTAMAEMMATSSQCLEDWGAMSAIQLQMLFAALDSQLIVDKFAKFACVDEGSAAERAFVAVEDWSNAGPPLSAPVAYQLFGDWIANGKDGWPGVEPARLAMPALVVASIPDRIVPEAVAAPLAGLLPNATLMRVDAGHVGMVVGSRAQTMLWAPLAEWLNIFPSLPLRER